MKITPDQFKKMLQTMSGKNYLSESLLKEVRDRGYGDYLYYSCPKEKAIEIVKELQRDKILPSHKTPESVFASIIE
ncbi:MAG: hypothetical protein ACOZBH_03955 [Patescibacteria group bacterium]